MKIEKAVGLNIVLTVLVLGAMTFIAFKISSAWKELQLKAAQLGVTL